MRLKVSNVCQLYDKTYPVTQTVNGVTFTNNGDGSVTVNGTAPTTKPASINTPHVKVNPGDKILMFSGYDIGGLKSAFVYVSQLNANGKWIADLGYPSLNGYLATCGKNTHYISPTFRVDPGNTATNAIIKLQLFDLTEMYGAGNEPTTVAQFRQDFPNEMYEYSPECWKKFRRLKYIANKEPVQLLDKSDLKTVVSKNVTATPNTTNGMWTISGAATASEYLAIGSYRLGTNFDIGDKLFLRHSNIDNSVYFPYAAWYDKDNKYLGEQDGMGIFSVTNPETAYIACYFATRTVGDINVTTQVQLFNLTRMYGKGNEPTAAEFVAQYPGFDYSVNKYNYLTLNRGKYIANKEPVQLLDKSKYPPTKTDGGVTFTNNGDGTITANGTSTKNYASYKIIKTPRPPIGHKILVLPENNSNAQSHIFIWGGTDNGIYRDDLGYGGRILTITGIGVSLKRSYTTISISLNVNKNWVMNNHIYKPQLFDLTEMYGAGNEPTTVAQFRADYPNELYDYNPYNAITFR